MMISLKDDPRFVTHCYDLFIKVQLRHEFPFFNLVGNRSSTLLLSEKFSLAYQKVNKICNAFSNSNELPTLYPDSIATLTALLVSKVTENPILKQKLLLLFSETYDIQMLNEATLNKYFGANSIIESKPFHFWNNRDMEYYDVIITDTPLLVAEEKTILYNTIVDDPTIISIRKMIKNNQNQLIEKIWKCHL